MEEWKDIKDYEGLYQVSNYGRVKSLNHNHTSKEKILSLKPNGRGYIRVTLCKNNIKKPYSVHRLVAITFIPNPNNYPLVNHKDEDKTNNHVDNLEWCTYKYNINYGTGIKRRSEKCSKTLKDKYSRNKSPHAKKVKCITTGEIFDCIKDAEEKYGVANQNISACCKGKQKSAGKHPVTKEKLVWEYVE